MDPRYASELRETHIDLRGESMEAAREMQLEHRVKSEGA